MIVLCLVIKLSYISYDNSQKHSLVSKRSFYLHKSFFLKKKQICKFIVHIHLFCLFYVSYMKYRPTVIFNSWQRFIFPSMVNFRTLMEYLEHSINCFLLIYPKFNYVTWRFERGINMPKYDMPKYDKVNMPKYQQQV